MKRFAAPVVSRASSQRHGMARGQLLLALVLLAASFCVGRYLLRQSSATSQGIVPARQVESSTDPRQFSFSAHAHYLMHCANCHGPEGRGDGAAPQTGPPPRDFAARPWRDEVSPDSIRRVILKGIPGTAMPSFRAALSDADVEALAIHVNQLANRESAEPKAISADDALLRAAGFVAVTSADAPALKLINATDKTLELADLRGQLVLLNFWGVTCEHCLKRMPQLETLSQDYQAQGLAVVHLCADSDDAAAAQTLATRAAPTSVIYLDDTGLANSQYEVQVLPTVWLIDPQGRLLAKASGARDWDSPAMRQLLERWLPRP